VESLQGIARAAAQLGAPQLALEVGARQAGVFDTSTAAAVQAQRVALGLRWARIENTLEPGSACASWSAKALAASDDAVKRLLSRPRELDDVARLLLFDRLSALTLCNRYGETRDLGAALAAADIETPVWALGPLASAHLVLREPRAAEALYRRILAADPYDADAALGLFYALSEDERPHEAQAWIDAYAVRVSARAPEQRVDVRAAAAMARVSADQLQAAEALAASLLADAPLVPAARATWASTQAALGRPRRADEEFRRALALDPDNAQLHTERVGLLIDLQDHAQARAELDKAITLQPGSPIVQRAQRRWDVHNMYELQVAAGYGRSRSASPLGSRDWEMDSTLWSRPLGRDWRVFGHDWRTEAQLDGVDARWRRSGIGIERRIPDWRWSAELASATPRNADAALQEGTLQRRTGITLGARWQPADAWALTASADTLPPEVPLRARAAGINGKGLTIGGHWSERDSRSVSASLSGFNFSDGNHRRSAMLGWAERWYSSPRWRLATELWLYASRNDLDGAAYFNPARDASATVDGIAEWLGWRRYDNAFRQRMVVTLGSYKQRGFGSGPVFAARMEHVWSFDRTLQLRYSIGRTVRPYDGNTTGRTEAQVALEWRF
jgi:biofilm PGA synthesis protein PgaA